MQSLHKIVMLKLIPVHSHSRHSCNFFRIILINLIFLISENLLQSFSEDVVLILFFNFSFTMTIILRNHNKRTSLNTTLLNDQKLREYTKLSHEFAKLAIICFTVALISFGLKHHFQLHSNCYLELTSYLLYIFIMLSLNSKEFLKEIANILYSFTNLSTESVNFNAVLVADVWTSFSRPSSQIAGNFRPVKIILLR